MPIIVRSTSSYFRGVDPSDPSTLLPHMGRRDGQPTGPNDISPITKQYIGGLDDFTFQIMNLQPIYGYGLHTLQVNGTTRNLKANSRVKIGLVDSEGNDIQWSASSTRYGFEISFFVSEDNNVSGPAIFEISGKKPDGTIISLIERFVIDTNAPPRPYGIGVQKRGFHTVDVGWLYATGFSSPYRQPTHDRDLQGFHIWASTASFTGDDTTKLTSSAPIKTVLASDANISALTTRSFGASVDGIDQSLIVTDKTLYFYVSSFDDTGNENMKSLSSANLVFGTPGIPTASNPNVWITIPERNVGQMDYSSFDDNSPAQRTALLNKYQNEAVYTTGAFPDVNRGKLSAIYNNVFHTSSGELRYRTFHVTSSVAVTGSRNYTKYVLSSSQPFGDKYPGSGALFVTANTLSVADRSQIVSTDALFSDITRMFFVASGSQSFTAGPTGSLNNANNYISYPFPMLPMKPNTDYILSFRLKATSSLTESNRDYKGTVGDLLPPLKMAFTGSTFSSRFSMSADHDNYSLGLATAPLTFSLPRLGPGADGTLLDLTTTQDPSNDPNSDKNSLRMECGGPPVKVQIKFNSSEIGTITPIFKVGGVGTPSERIGYSSAAPNFDMTLPFFFFENPTPSSTGSIMGPIVGDPWFKDGINLRNGTIKAAGGGGIIPFGYTRLNNNAGVNNFLNDSQKDSGAGNSGSRFSGTWLGECKVYEVNHYAGAGHFITGSNFYGVTGSNATDVDTDIPYGPEMINFIGLTGSKTWMANLTSAPPFFSPAERTNKAYPFKASRGSTPGAYRQYAWPKLGIHDKPQNNLYGYPYGAPPGGGFKANQSSTSGALFISGSSIPSHQSLGIDMGDPTINHGDGHHHVLEFRSLVGITSKGARSRVLRAFEAGTSEGQMIKNIGDSQGPAFQILRDSGSFFVYSPPSASYSRQTLTTPRMDQNLNKLFAMDSSNNYYDQIADSDVSDYYDFGASGQNTFYVTGSGFITRYNEQLVNSLYVVSENAKLIVSTLNDAPAPIKLSQFTTYNQTSPGFGIIGQTINGGTVQALDGYDNIGNSGSAVLKIITPTPTFRDVPVGDNHGIVRFKIVNKGGFTGSIYYGNENRSVATSSNHPGTNLWRTDPRCGEYLEEEIRNIGIRNNSEKIDSQLTMSFFYTRTRSPGEG